ncbi:hypothetical protein [Chryseobacterium hagamense]|uniref:Uncharacterized protein n=1 Tax=Chryseobacterium hagamense TaxID=395935 RepID=A0A511YQM7_9FLAO|nr:hypothetical protein [Chryseobacterium hagamense]GEN77492.1 hypothetical protein CHA01nite_32320 [Chryseobacterium hagamense]
MANKTVHKDDSKKSIISTSDLHDPIDNYDFHLGSLNISATLLPDEMLDLYRKSASFNRFGFNVLKFCDEKINTNHDIIPNYKHWSEVLSSDASKLRSVELLNHFKEYVIIIKKHLSVKEYQIIDIFTNNNTFKAIFIVSEENVVNDDFINDFYDLAFKYEAEFSEKLKKEINFSFVGYENIDVNELNIDKFFKFENGK